MPADTESVTLDCGCTEDPDNGIFECSDHGEGNCEEHCTSCNEYLCGCRREYASSCRSGSDYCQDCCDCGECRCENCGAGLNRYGECLDSCYQEEEEDAYRSYGVAPVVEEPLPVISDTVDRSLSFEQELSSGANQAISMLYDTGVADSSRRQGYHSGDRASLCRLEDDASCNGEVIWSYMNRTPERSEITSRGINTLFALAKRDKAIEIDQQCGGHIHVDWGNETLPQDALLKLYRAWMITESAFFAISASGWGRHRDSGYSENVPKNSGVDRADMVPRGRYAIAFLTRHNTAEFRVWQAMLHPRKVRLALTLSAAIVSWAADHDTSVEEPGDRFVGEWTGTGTTDPERVKTGLWWILENLTLNESDIEDLTWALGIIPKGFREAADEVITEWKAGESSPPIKTLAEQLVENEAAYQAEMAAASRRQAERDAYYENTDRDSTNGAENNPYRDSTTTAAEQRSDRTSSRREERRGARITIRGLDGSGATYQNHLLDEILDLMPGCNCTGCSRAADEIQRGNYRLNLENNPVSDSGWPSSTPAAAQRAEVRRVAQTITDGREERRIADLAEEQRIADRIEVAQSDRNARI